MTKIHANSITFWKCHARQMKFPDLCCDWMILISEWLHEPILALNSPFHPSKNLQPSSWATRYTITHTHHQAGKEQKYEKHNESSELGAWGILGRHPCRRKGAKASDSSLSVWVVVKQRWIPLTEELGGWVWSALWVGEAAPFVLNVQLNTWSLLKIITLGLLRRGDQYGSIVCYTWRVGGFASPSEWTCLQFASVSDSIVISFFLLMMQFSGWDYQDDDAHCTHHESKHQNDQRGDVLYIQNMYNKMNSSALSTTL